LKLDDLAVKGKSVGLDIYTVLDIDRSEHGTSMLDHNTMHNFYATQHFDEAINICEQLKGCFEGKMDEYYDIWIERCKFMKTQDLPEDWDGIFRATTK
jgi:capsule polysaccharide export protein KpsE/RkpR